MGREAYENREAIDTAITVGATIAAPFTGGASLVGLTIYKAMEGAAEGGVLGALAGAATIGNAFLYEFTGGMVSYDLSYSYEDGFGASVGSGMKIVEGLGVGSTLSYNEQNGFGMSLGLQAGTSALSYNAGLSYSQSGGISANAGIGLGLGRNAATGSYSSTLNLGVSYNRRDGFGTSVGISRNNNVVMPGVGASISRSEYGGWGADITSNQYGQTEGTAGRPGFGGVSGGLSWSERDGFTASFNVSGTNAFSYNSQTGLSSNSDFLSQSAMNNGLSQGVAQTDEEKAHAARVEAEERARAAQNRNNQESGAAAVSGAGVLTQRRDEDGLPAHGAPGLNDPGQTLSSSGSFGPEGESSGVGRRPLSSEDKAAFWENWRGETRAQTDASLADLRRMGYDTSELEGRVQAYRNNQDSRPGTTSTPQPTTHQSQGTGLYGGVVQNILNSAMSGASSLWDRITGGRPVAHQTAPVFELDNGARLPFENQGSGYGRVRNLTRNDGTTYTSVPHSGLDQPQASGTPVPVVADGRVIALSRNYENNQNGGGYGAFVLVQHNNGIFTLYGHNSNVLVNIGDTVTRGQVISNVGNSGNSFGAHMHYEVRTGFNVDPRAYISQTNHQNPATFNWNQWIQDHPEE
ncbi:peptidase, M23 family [Leptospira santarosai str. 2000030832]|nr:peptidase, M23 family [Leptospira santarosai str. 2000030832]